MNPSLPCPCGATAAPTLGKRNTPTPKPLNYGECCGLWHDQLRQPEAPERVEQTPQALMRSRYSAFVLGLTDYLLATWHPSKRPADLTLDTHTKWLGLTVLSQTPADASTALEAQVHFVARSRVQGRGQRLEEISRFTRPTVHDTWVYVDGEIRE